VTVRETREVTDEDSSRDSLSLLRPPFPYSRQQKYSLTSQALVLYIFLSQTRCQQIFSSLVSPLRFTEALRFWNLDRAHHLLPPNSHLLALLARASRYPSLLSQPYLSLYIVSLSLSFRRRGWGCSLSSLLSLTLTSFLLLTSLPQISQISLSTTL